MGGRGVPYRFGSRTDVNGQTQEATIGQLRAILHRLFRSLKRCASTMPGAACSVSARLVHDGGIRSGERAWLGGRLCGLGVSSSNLAGRTLTDLVLKRDTELARLPG
jgi:glycine/D-amino acid oxidase-like deaminating enzyme